MCAFCLFLHIFGKEDEPVSYLWLEALQWLRNIYQHVHEPPAFPLYAGIMSLALCNVTASIKAVHWDPFFSYGTRWLNDRANVGCLLAGVCGLPWSCTSRSEQQVSHCDACVCLRCWNKWVGPLPLVAKLSSGSWLVRGPMPQNANYWRDSALLGMDSLLDAMLLWLFLCGK